MQHQQARLGVAVVGLGSIARRAHLPALAARTDVAVTGLVSRSGRGAAELAAEHRFPVTAWTLDQVLAHPPDAALVLTASAAHVEVASQLLEAGIPVYLEKPMALDLPGARRLTACADAAGLLLLVGFNRRYAPFYRAAREAVPEPIVCSLAKHRDEAVRRDPPAFAVWDDVIHLIDLSRWYMGEPVEVRAAVRQDESGGFAALSALLAYGGGRSATVVQSYRSGGVTERVELHGGRTSARVDDLETLAVMRGDVEQVRRHGRWTGILDRRGFTAALDHFLDCVRTGRAPLQTAADALRSHELADATLAAAGVTPG